MVRLKVKRYEEEDKEKRVDNWVKLSKSVCKSVGVSNGDIIIITGKKTTAAKVRKCSESLSGGFVWLNKIARRNSGSNVNDYVRLKKGDVKEANWVAISKPPRANLQNWGESGLRELLDDKIIYSRDEFNIKGYTGYFRVLRKLPEGPLVIGDNTDIDIRSLPSKEIINPVLEDAQTVHEKTIDRRNNLETMILHQAQLAAVSLGLLLTVLSIALDSIGDFSIPELPLQLFGVVFVVFLYSAFYSYRTLRKHSTRTIGLSRGDIDQLLYGYPSDSEVNLQRIENFQGWAHDNSKDNRELFANIIQIYLMTLVGWLLMGFALLLTIRNTLIVFSL